MRRRDQAYWQRLRKDRRSNAAAILATVAAVAANTALLAAAFPGTHYEARANLLYLPLMLPMAWWVLGLKDFEARPVRLWRPAMAVCGLVSAGSLLVHLYQGRDWMVPAIVLGITLAAAAASLLLLHGSLMDREGPAR
ncbi:hypothetical protein [Roseomonas indoligenes]|uniref:Uncharacterized protein n=1 Tax=Roseomonas indoligenes TaxID=2820811 RepID=A0A940S389_9PROT|nr:hypothetical protein [Pararoseomonas indoligenes]MBP0491981.1 hypothetical protein [Pararoseomonas indoligenes]